MDCRVLLALVCCGMLSRGSAALDSDSPQRRLAQIEAMSETEKEELRVKKERFDRLSKEEQDRLRQLYRDIHQETDAEKLQRIMVRYGEWLKSLPIDQRAELAGLAPQERLQRIKKILEMQERQRFQELVYRKLSPKDYEVIKQWFGELVVRNMKSLGSKLPPEVLDEFARKPDPVDALFEIVRYRRDTLKEANLRSFDIVEITDKDIATLSGQLSPEARKTLEEAASNNDRLNAVKYWVFAATISRRFQRVSDEQLRRFMAERVDKSTRDWLENLPRDQMLNHLRRMYYTDNFRGREGDNGRRNFRGFGGPGEGWPGWPWMGRTGPQGPPDPSKPPMPPPDMNGAPGFEPPKDMGPPKDFGPLQGFGPEKEFGPPRGTVPGQESGPRKDSEPQGDAVPKK
jgi:hypothetical protein